MESESRGAEVCAGCAFPRLGRARLDADRVPCLVVLVLARAARSGLQTAGRGGHCATLGRPSLALATAHPRGGCRYRSDPTGRTRAAAPALIKSAPMRANHDRP